MGRALIGGRTDDQPQCVPQVETMLDKVTGKAIEQLRMRGGVGVAEVVDGLDEAAAELGLP